jgi:hypothetical protein
MLRGLISLMHLPDYIGKAFKRINPSATQENDYYGAYNLLLWHAFPGQQGYVVHPQVIFTTSSHFSMKGDKWHPRFHRLIQVVAQSTA